MSVVRKQVLISFSSPPLESNQGVPFLSQNRQFQWTKTDNVILPVIPAYGITALHRMGYETFWDDAIAEKLSYDKWLERLFSKKPKVIFIETKTPVIKQHWKIINQIKQNCQKIKNWQPIVVLMGDHVTALPEESLINSNVDYILTGGDYDFMMINLVNHLFRGEKLESGFYFRTKGLKNSSTIKNTGKFALLHHHLDDLPIIDRKLTNWHLYGFNNTNFKYKPGAYIMSGRDCWWGRCTFCSWTTTHPAGTFRTFSVKHTINEIKYLVSLGIREIFDDSGSLPIGKWLEELCRELINTGLNKKVVLGCNMRFGALSKSQYQLMKEAGFRFILYGFESANQHTLDKIVKNTQTSDALDTLSIAKSLGFEPHITVMVGYPWESKKDALYTLAQAKILFQKGLVDSMQATIVIPYPGTPLFKYCQDNNLLLSKDWDDYDMKNPVMKTTLTSSEIHQLVKSLFYGILTPKFILRKITSIRSFSDIKFLLFYSYKYFLKLSDF